MLAAALSRSDGGWAAPWLPAGVAGALLCLVFALGAERVLAAEGPMVTAPALPATAPGTPDWRLAPEVTGFRRVPSGAPPAQQTHVRIGFDENNLHLLFRCPTGDPAKLKGSARAHDAPVWEDDAVELLLDPGRTRAHFFHFVVNCRGARYDSQDGQASWNGDWQCATQISPDRGEWTATLAIPFATLGRTTPRPGEVWGANYCRDSPLVEEHSAWAFPGERFEEPARFGTLAFWPDAPAVRVEGLGDIVAGPHTIRAIVTGRGATPVVVSVTIANKERSLLRKEFLFVPADRREAQTTFAFGARPAGEYQAEFRARVAGSETFYIASLPIVVRPPVLVSAPH